MDQAVAPAAAPATVTFHDGLGERHRVVDRVRNEPVEILCLRGELTAVPSFEFALRERVSHLSTFRHACYARVRSVERLKNPASTLALVSDVTPGVRLSEILAFAEKSQVTLDIDAALCLLRQLVPAVAMLHEHAPEIAHGAIAAERVVVTPSARIIVVEHVLGSAIGELKFSSDRYWKELRIAVPGTSPQARFDHRSDVTQIGVVALSLILGRPLLADETPGQLGDVVASSWANSARGGLEPLPAGLRAWLMRALQLDPKNRFDSAVDAQEDLERVLGESDYLAAPSTLEAFLAEYRAAHEPVAAVPAPPASAPVNIAPTASVPAPAVQTVPAAPADDANEFRHSMPKRDERDVKASERTADAMRHLENAVRHIETVATPTPTPVTYAYPPPVAPAWNDTRRATPVRDDSEIPAAPTPVVQAYRPSDRAAESVDIEMTPLAQTFRASTAPPSSEIRRAAAKSEEHDPLSAFKADTPRHVETPVPPAKDLFTPAPERREISFSDVAETAFVEQEEEKPVATRKWWPLAAAAVLVAVAAAGVPAARRYMAPAAVVPTDGTLIVTTNPPGAQLFIDGVERGVTPLTLPVKPGAHSLELRGNGAPRLMPITVTAGTQVSQYIELPTTASMVGQLRIRTEPAGARVSVDGVARGPSPVTVTDLPPGEHAVVVDSDLGSIKQTVTIEAGNTASLTVPLAPEGAPVSGWMAISAPGVVELFEAGRLLGTSQSDRLMVSAGRHDIEIVSEALGFKVTRVVQVTPGKVTPIKVEFPKGTIALNATPWAEVWVDGEKIGDTPIGNYQLTLGPHDFVFRHPDLGEQRHTAMVTLKTPARLSVDLRKK